MCRLRRWRRGSRRGSRRPLAICTEGEGRLSHERMHFIYLFSKQYIE
ncbi:Integrin alpha-1 [Frankliniella fusca]|uniref:Integrin alpha-1 n=1 Tax=Frankliniella fusca TaxID=407009 RepID=A0AAE1LIW1_9NEOP|nr:Integrin alpha-1 [Frankliniella fusca]